MKKKTKIGRDVKEYMKTAKSSKDKSDFNQRRDDISFQLSKLKEAGYIKIKKSFRGNYPLTTCAITEKGHNAYASYVNSIADYFKAFRKE